MRLLCSLSLAKYRHNFFLFAHSFCSFLLFCPFVYTVHIFGARLRALCAMQCVVFADHGKTYCVCTQPLQQHAFKLFAEHSQNYMAVNETKTMERKTFLFSFLCIVFVYCVTANDSLHQHFEFAPLHTPLSSSKTFIHIHAWKVIITVSNFSLNLM